MKSKVLFTRTISPEMVLTMYEKLGKNYQVILRLSYIQEKKEIRIS